MLCMLRGLLGEDDAGILAEAQVRLFPAIPGGT